jgi:hypothetical protein
MGPRLTNFALGALLSEKHVAVAKGNKAGATKITSAEALARLHGLHGEVSSHRLGNGVDVLAGFQALFGEQLDFGAPVKRKKNDC